MTGYGRHRNEKTSFIPIVVFGKQAENCDRYLAKGRKVAVNGRIQTGSYEKDGRTVYTTEVIANKVEFLGGSKVRAKSGQADTASRPASSRAASAAEQAPASGAPQGAPRQRLTGEDSHPCRMMTSRSKI